MTPPGSLRGGEGSGSALTPRAEPHVITMERLYSLRDRLARAMGPNLLLERDIALAIGGYTAKSPTDYESTGIVWRGYSGYAVPNYTASLDAAVSLVPGDGYYKLFVSKAKNATVTIPVPPDKWWKDFSAETAPLALCLARIEYEIAKAREPASRGEAENNHSENPK